MKAISIKQPWANRIIYGNKRVENRTWTTAHRGDILIHASKTWDSEVGDCPDVDRESVAYGAVVGVAFLDMCILATDVEYWVRKRPELSWLIGHEWIAGPFLFVLDNVRAFRNPIPYRGELQIFEVESVGVDEALESAREMLTWDQVRKGHKRCEL